MFESCSGCATKFISKADIFGGRFEVLIKRDTSFKTLPGAILSLIAVVLIGGYAGGQMLNILDKTRPIVRNVFEFDYEASHIDIDDQDILPMV